MADNSRNTNLMLKVWRVVKAATFWFVAIEASIAALIIGVINNRPGDAGVIVFFGWVLLWWIYYYSNNKEKWALERKERENKNFELEQIKRKYAEDLLKNMQHSITINNQNANINNSNSSNVNFGDNNALSNAIQQLPAENNELKALLNQLQILINNSILPDTDKKEALSETKIIAEAALESTEQQQSIVRKALRYFKGLSTELEGIPETALKFGETIAQITSFFGI